MGSLQEHFGTLPPAPDRRSEARTTPASLTQVEFGGGHSGIVLNISEAGMAVAVAHVLAVGERLPRVRFLLPNSAREPVQSVEISAEIVWLSESKKWRRYAVPRVIRRRAKSHFKLDCFRENGSRI